MQDRSWVFQIVVALSVLAVTALLLGLLWVDGQLAQVQRVSMADAPGETPLLVPDAEARYQLWNLAFREASFEWNLRANRIIFWVSILVTMSGIVFAFWQFMEAGREERASMHADELEIRTQVASIAFKSRSIAALILFVSIAYLLIYVSMVMPVRTAHPDMMIEAERGLAPDLASAKGPPVDANEPPSLIIFGDENAPEPVCNDCPD